MSKIFLITAPSGAGKTTLAQSIARTGDWTECISHTTREMRDGEVEGKTYYFITREAFKDGIKLNMFAEKVEYGGNLYGVSKDEIERVMKTGKNVFIIVENDGYRQIKRQYPEAIGIFLHMSKEDCLANMLLRGDSYTKAMERIAYYNDEMINRGQYDYIVKNVRHKKFETEAIIRAIIKQYSNDLTIRINAGQPTNPFTNGHTGAVTSSRLDEPVGY